MGTFRHTPDDVIYINTTAVPLSFFITLYPAYALPVGYTSRYYEQTITHYTSNGNIGIETYTLPYADGDTYITAEAAIAAAYAASVIPTVSLAEAKLTRIAEMMSYATTIKNSGVIVAGYIHQSTSDAQQDRLTQFEAYTRAAAMPAGCYIDDINYAHVTAGAISDFSDIADAITNFYYLVMVAADTHRTAINALGSVAAVQAYDFTTGWPPAPGVSTVTFYATYAANINGVRGGGVLAGTAFGLAAVAAGYLDLAHGDARYVSYDANLNADAELQQVVVFTNKPNYNGAPALNKVLFCISKNDGMAENLTQLRHDADGHLYLMLNDETGALIADIDFGAWAPTAGTDYAFVCANELFDGNNKLYINNVQFGATNTATGTRDANIALLRVGSGYNSAAAEVSDFSIKDFAIYHLT